MIRLKVRRRLNRWVAGFVVAFAPALALADEGPDDARPEAVRAAVGRALPTLQKSLAGYAEKRDCFSCHHQAVSLLALRVARSRGFEVNDDVIAEAVELTLGDLKSAFDGYRKGKGQPGGKTRAGYALWALEEGGHPADEVTEAVSGYLLGAAENDGRWSTSSQRPPIEASAFTTTGVTLLGLRYYAPEAKGDVLKERARNARAWLCKSRPADTEERVFRLWGLKYADGSADELKDAVKDILATQRDDGGWSQTEKLSSDAYATGSALVALHEAGGLSTDDPAYRRGVSYLLRTQKPDGTWFVSSRSKPFQPYFESGFPYGKDQFIAVAASGWAAAALALSLPAGD